MSLRVLVTGATGGIGSAMVALFAERGDDVFAMARPSPTLDALCGTPPRWPPRST